MSERVLVKVVPLFRRFIFIHNIHIKLIENWLVRVGLFLLLIKTGMKILKEQIIYYLCGIKF